MQKHSYVSFEQFKHLKGRIIFSPEPCYSSMQFDVVQFDGVLMTESIDFYDTIWYMVLPVRQCWGVDCFTV